MRLRRFFLFPNCDNISSRFHRQRVVFHLKDYSRGSNHFISNFGMHMQTNVRCICLLTILEKADLRAVFMQDAKNYHAWTHRQWLVRTFGLWDGEIEFLDGGWQKTDPPTDPTCIKALAFAEFVRARIIMRLLSCSHPQSTRNDRVGRISET